MDLDALSDLVFSTSEGAYIVARATRDPDLVRGQLLQVRAYLELLFTPDLGSAQAIQRPATRRRRA